MDGHENRSVGTFSVVDYCVFGGLFFISAAIGVYFAIVDRKKKSSENYLLAGRSMSGWPIALSLTASFMSAITVLGTPAEVYVYGTMFWWFMVSYTLTVIITAKIFTPVFYNMGISSTYEYLEARFNRVVRIAGTCAFILQTVIYMGMVMYMPALALNKVTGLSLVVSIVATALVCVFYTTIGGMKAVVWNDVVQSVVMCIGFLAVIVQGSDVVGGFVKVFKIASDGGRIDFFNFDFDPRVRHSVWSICIGGTLMWLSVYAINQSMVQRYLSCKSLQHAQLSLYINNVGLFFILNFACLSGLVMFAVYKHCDPLSFGEVSKSDQLIPYLVMDIFRSVPGIPGIFVASAYSGTLSTVSTGINALACSTYEDLIKPVMPRLSGSKAVILSKFLVVVYGLLGLGVAFLASLVDKMLTMALKVFGIIGGPMLGVFCLGLFTPVANSVGSLVGLFCGFAVGIWLGVGSFLCPPSNQFTRHLPVTTEGCYFNNSYTGAPIDINSSSASLTTSSPPSDSPSICDSAIASTFYSLSYCHFCTLAVVVTWSVGVAVSLCTGGIKSRKNVAPHLLAFSGDLCCCVGSQHCSCCGPSYVRGEPSDEKNELHLLNGEK